MIGEPSLEMLTRVSKHSIWESFQLEPAPKEWLSSDELAHGEKPPVNRAHNRDSAGQASFGGGSDCGSCGKKVDWLKLVMERLRHRLPGH